MSASIRIMIGVLFCLAFALGAERAEPAPTSRTGQTLDRRLVVSEDRPVEVGVNDFATIQPHLAAHPQNAAHLVGSAILADKWGDPRNPDIAPGTSTCAALTSVDAGRFWIRHDFPLKDCGDPWVAILPNGNTIFLALNGSELLAFRSADGGKTWNDSPVSFGRRHDHGTLGVDRSAGPFGGSVYVVSRQDIREGDGKTRSTVFVARSSDGGVTFGEPTRSVWSNWITNSANPLSLSDGILVVPFAGFRPSAFKDAIIDLSWSILSSDGGAKFSAPRFIADCNGHFPQAAIDASGGTFRDHLYWACSDRNSRHIYLLYSTDRGETWSEPVVVNRGSGTNPYVGNLAIAVNREGVVGISWYDGRNDARGYRRNFRCQELFFTVSLDGGRTFLPEVKVSSAENCPDTPANAEAGRRFVLGGEYHGLAAKTDGQFQFLWADSRTGIYQLRTATVHIAD